MPPSSTDELDALFSSLPRDQWNYIAVGILSDSIRSPGKLLELFNGMDRAMGKVLSWTPAQVSKLLASAQLNKFSRKSSPMMWETAFLSRLLIDFFETAPPPVEAFLKKLLFPQGDGLPTDRYYIYSYTSFPLYAKCLYATFKKNDDLFRKLSSDVERIYGGQEAFNNVIAFLIEAPLSGDYLESLPTYIRGTIAVNAMIAFLDSSQKIYSPESRLATLRKTPANDPFFNLSRRYVLWTDLMGADRSRISAALSSSPPLMLQEIQGISAWERFMAGDPAGALEGFRKMASTLRKTVTKKRIPLPDPFGLFHALSLFLLSRKDKSFQSDLEKYISLAKDGNTDDIVGYRVLRALLMADQGLDLAAINAFMELKKTTPLLHSPFSRALMALGGALLLPEETKKESADLLSYAQEIRPLLPLVTAIVAGSLAKGPLPAKDARSLLEDPVLASLFAPFDPILDREDPWERTLTGIESVLVAGSSPDAKESSDRRIVWLFNVKNSDLEGVEQSRRKGEWKGARRIAFRRFHARETDLPLSEADKKVIRTFRQESGYGSSSEWYPDSYLTPLALCGHPAVYDMSHPEERIELEESLPELLITEDPGGFRIDISHRSQFAKLSIEPVSATRYRVVNLSSRAVDLAKRLPPGGLVVPREAKDRLLALLGRQSPFVTLRAEIAASDLPAEEGRPAPVLQLSPFAEGLSVTAGVRPFGPDGPFFHTARGGRLVAAQSEGTTRHARRDPARESALLEALLAEHLPILAETPNTDGVWVLEDTSSALELLEALASCPVPVDVEWPQGEKMRVTASVSTKKLRLSLQSARDWFEISGTVQVDENLVVGMEAILEALPRATGRFVPLSEGRFLALTHELKSRLEKLQTIAEEGRRLSLPGTVAMEDLFSEAGEVKGDKTWKEFRKRLREAADFSPVLPSTLAGELRDYQLEGFSWMSRLARWGAGACLADDMGLGKTVQAIAVMLDLSKNGPVLVVAPTSVCHNWVAELARFAPTLRVHELREASDRKSRVEDLRSHDVLITSYGLLAIEEELLSAPRWAMAVFDEAQAFKNAESKRAQAARKIGAEFRLALTGTPVENDLDELWSLFNILNPRLLGSRERFASRFAGPIERSKDTRVLSSLRALVRPFMLRRTKTAVLSELPPRTEITLEVELPAEERALYEALRRKALEAIGAIGRDGGSQRIHILAEIMKLRRALCHPALVEPLTLLPGAKIEAFQSLVDELLQNRHKALVFSQFTGYLERVAQALDARGISYQYLDGSTPPKERERRVEAFQSGQGDLFLISLRAGGTGLNLTAADYVIHLDPWWNPAVEDQASDRAHRIGQQRPVTIYRLIVRESIEEKIIDLHRRKRDLASDLLEGTELSGKLTNDELIALIGK